MFSDEFIQRFLSYTSNYKPDSCWWWNGQKDKNGYGVIKLRNKCLKAHRIAHEIFVGPIPEKMCVLHKCDNPACINPKHLFLGTPGDNARDRDQKGRHGDISGEKNGRAKLNTEQVQEIRNIYQNMKITKTALGRMFGVTEAQIRNIVTNQQWKG